MTSIERIAEMLQRAASENRLFPATFFYNEGWLLRLVLDCLSGQQLESHPLNFALNSKWYSETLLPSQFLARKRHDHLAEQWTRADGVIGQVILGSGGLVETTLKGDATQFIVIEAKLFNRLARGVTHAAYFDGEGWEG
jgi:hypothetical protein